MRAAITMRQGTARGVFSALALPTRLILALSALAVPALAGADSSALPPARAEYYGEVGCSHCDTFAARELPAAELASGVKVELELIDIMSTEGFRRCEERLSDLGYSFSVFPVLVIGSSAYQGNAAIEANLLAELEHYAAHGAYRSGQPDTGARTDANRSLTTRMTWSALPVFAAGLVDGVNPCAFTTLLFFMSYLGLRGGSKRRMLAAGLSFAAGVFVSYFLVGFGLFGALRAGGKLRSARLVLRVVVSVLAAAYCALTARDIVRLRRGRVAEMTLALPDSVRSRINAAIRAGTGSPFMIAGVFVTGVVVSVLELACTGQVYFPAISVMVQADASLPGLGLLFLYNLAFITPLLAVLFLALVGLRQEAVRSYFTRRLVPAKAAQAIIVAALAVLVWLF